MSLARVTAFALDGVDARRVEVEADVRGGLPAFTIVGLADKAVREARDRVRSALINSGFEFPQKRITVNLAPAYLRKIGPSFDLPLAIAVLAAAGQLDRGAVDGCAVMGELGLAGDLRPIRGALAIAEAARRHGVARLLVPRSRAREAALVAELEILGVTTIVEAADVLRGAAPVPELPPEDEIAAAAPDGAELPDLRDVRGHNGLIYALEVAAAGGHNLYLHGPPGTGKTMLARRVPSILPPLSRPEAIEVTRVQSIAGLHGGGGLVTARPFRAPHHTVSAAGLVGGGSHPMPGEATLAHQGVLFLDELSEFSRSSLEALRQPLEDGRVVIVRGQRVMMFPTRFMLVAASNPCPCGMGEEACRCTASDLSRHDRRLSGPLLDRIDLSLEVMRPPAAALRDQIGPRSAAVRERVIAARARQATRLAGSGAACNAEMTARMLRELSGATPSALRLLYELHDRNRLSARAHGRILRVARTVADLAQSDLLHPEHISAAAALRLDDLRLRSAA